LQQACQLDGDVAPSSKHVHELPAPSASSASSLAQREREFQKAVQPGGPISALLSSERQPLMVASGGISAACKEPTLLRKLETMKKETAATKTLKASSRLQGITGEGVAAYEKQGEEVRMKVLQSQKSRIVVQMPVQVPRSTTGSLFEDA
jgi:cell cycle serine/threonine-protein kinase CDC5/MSD2